MKQISPPPPPSPLNEEQCSSNALFDLGGFFYPCLVSWCIVVDRVRGPGLVVCRLAHVKREWQGSVAETRHPDTHIR